MTERVKMHCATCEICFMNNHPYSKNAKAPLKLFPANRPGQSISIDLIGKIQGPGRYSWILTIVDRFTRFVQAVPLINAESTTIAHALMEHYFWKYGCAESLHSDRAGNLDQSTVMKILYNLLSIYKTRTTSYHARGNGQCEVYNKHIVVMIKKLVAEHQKDWEHKLNIVCFALNSSVCSSTQYTPFKLHFGRELRGPADLLYDTSTTEFYKSGAHLVESRYHEIRKTKLFDCYYVS